MADVTNPHYGRIGDLCAYLGYAQNGPRQGQYNAFRTGIIKFRKSYIKIENITSFPLDIASPIVQNCAKAYLEEKGVTFFPASSEAENGGFPCYPQQKDKILGALVKLICQQEYKSLVNCEYLNHIKEEAISEDDLEWITSPRSAQSSRSPSDFAPASEQTLPSAPPLNQLHFPFNKQDHQGLILSNTSIHLDWVYPLEALPKQLQLKSPTAWLTQKKRLTVERITHIDPFAVRYLHERSLYLVNQANSNQVKQFCIDVANQYQLTSEEQLLTPTKTRCERLITIIKSFNQDGYGLLYDENGVTKKTKEFEAAWRLRRTQWLEKWHGGNSQNVIEWLDKNSSGPSEINISKRKRLSSVSSDPKQTNIYSQKYPKRVNISENVVGEDLINPSFSPARAPSAQEHGERRGSTSVHQNPSVSKATSARYNERHKSQPSSLRHLDDPPRPIPFNSLSYHSTPVSQGLPAGSQKPWHTPQSDTEIPRWRAISQTIDSLDVEESEQSAEMAPVAQMTATMRSFSTTSTAASVEDDEDDGFTPFQPVTTSHEPQVAAMQNTVYSFMDAPKTSLCLMYQPQASSNPSAPESSLHFKHDSPTQYTAPDAIELSPVVTRKQLSLIDTKSLPPSPDSMNGSRNVPHKDPQSAMAAPDSGELPTPENRSRAYRHSGPFPGSRESIFPTQEQSTSMIKLSSRPEKPRLVFAIQDYSGIPDSESHLSKKSIFGLNAQGLFTLVCNKSGTDPMALQKISFKCQWENASVIVEKGKGDAGWKSMKDKLYNVFVNARKEFSDRMEFEVWIQCGDRVTKKKAGVKKESDSEDEGN